MGAPLDLHQVKVLVLFTLDKTPGPIPRHVIETAFALEDINVFEIQNALHDLIENENLRSETDEDGVPYLFVTEQGKCVADALKKDVPLSYREKALGLTAVEMSKLRTEVGIHATVSEISKNGQTYYSCDLALKDSDIALITLSAYSPNKLQAEMMAERFRKSPLDVYGKILKILTGTDENNDHRND